MTPPWLPPPNHHRPPWRWVVALAAGYIALTGTSFSPTFDRHAATRATSGVTTGKSHGVAVNGRIATTSDVRSDVRHG